METKETVTSALVPPRQDNYQHLSFNQLSDPELVGTALRVHAEGYTTMGFVSEDAVASDGTLDETIDHSRGCFTDYYLAVNPQNPRDMATMRKISVPPAGSVEDLPAYSLSKDGFYPEGINYLHDLESSGFSVKEIAGLARTKEAPSSSVYELLRRVFQEALDKDEAWFFSIVSDTYESITRYFGKTAFRVLGDDVKIDDHRVSERIQLKPAILMPSTFFKSLIRDIETAERPKPQMKLLGMFIYLSDGLTDQAMGDEPAEYRRRLLSMKDAEN